MAQESWRGAFRVLLANYIRSCRRRNVYWGLSEPEFEALTSGDCAYCGSEPKQRVWTRNPARTYIYNGVDRKNNKLGYTPDNVVSCCSFCNLVKGKTLSFEEARVAIAAIVGSRKKK